MLDWSNIERFAVQTTDTNATIVVDGVEVATMPHYIAASLAKELENTKYDYEMRMLHHKFKQTLDTPVALSSERHALNERYKTLQQLKVDVDKEIMGLLGQYKKLDQEV